MSFRRPRTPSRTPLILLGIGCFVAGLVVMWLCLVTFGSVDGIIKVPAFLASLVLLFAGIDRTGKGLFGKWFDTGFWLCFAWLIGLSVTAIIADWLPLEEYRDTKKTLAIPGNARPDLLSSHPLGTNNFSLDLLARSIYGARVSLLTVTVAVSISMIVGGMIGLFAGYYRRKLDTGIGVLTDSILAIPPLILLVALAAVLGQPTDVQRSSVEERGRTGHRRRPDHGAPCAREHPGLRTTRVRASQPTAWSSATLASSSGICCPTWHCR